MTPKKPRAGTKLLLATSFAIALIGGTAAWRSFINAEPQIVIPTYPKAPKPNGFDVYVQAGKMIVSANPQVDEVNDPKPPTDEKTRAQKYSLQNKEAWLKQNAASFALMQRALKLSCLAPPRRSSDNGFFSGFGRLRELARAKLIETHACEMRGNWNGAMQSRIDTFQMGNDIAQGGSLMPMLVGSAISGIGRSNLWPSIEKLNAAEARAASRRLEKIYARRVLFADVMTEEKYGAQSQVLEMMRDSGWRDVQKLDNTVTWQERVRALFTAKTTIMNNITRSFDVQIANARLPYATPKQVVPDAADAYTSITARSWDAARFSNARNDAANAMWLVALSLRAYQLEHKAFPATLRVLVPSYLKEIPADPFGKGESLRYKRVGDSYLLWSIGPDKRDNNGTPITHDKNLPALGKNKLPAILPQSKGDYVWGKNR